MCVGGSSAETTIAAAPRQAAIGRRILLAITRES
jgi:hypothetical protein